VHLRTSVVARERLAYVQAHVALIPLVCGRACSRTRALGLCASTCGPYTSCMRACMLTRLFAFLVLFQNYACMPFLSICSRTTLACLSCLHVPELSVLACLVYMFLNYLSQEATKEEEGKEDRRVCGAMRAAANYLRILAARLQGLLILRHSC